MNWMSFVASLVKALAWPLVVLVVIVMFRSQIASVVGKVKRLKAGAAGVEADFEEQVEKAESTLLISDDHKERERQQVLAESEAPAIPDTEKQTRRWRDILVQQIVARKKMEAAAFVGNLAEPLVTSPASAVVTAYARLEDAIIQELKRRPGAASEPVPAPLLDVAVRYQVLAPSEGAALRELRDLRNQVAHNQASIDSAAAVSYLRLAGRLFASVHRLPGQNS